MLLMLWKLMSITVVIALVSTNHSVDEQEAAITKNRALRDAIGKLARAQENLARSLTDEATVAWQILDDAIGHLIRAEYPMRDLF